MELDHSITVTDNFKAISGEGIGAEVSVLVEGNAGEERLLKIFEVGASVHVASLALFNLLLVEGLHHWLVLLSLLFYLWLF